MALTIATGFVVDDAIVVIENITRHLEAGHGPMQARCRRQEIGFTVLSMSMSLVAVFIPILLMGGIVGRLFREFAVTLSVAIVVSLVVSLTTTPMMCARLLQVLGATVPHGRLYRASANGCSMDAAPGYEITLPGCCGIAADASLVTAGDDCATVYLYIIVPKGFFPQQDTGPFAARSRPIRRFRSRRCAS